MRLLAVRHGQASFQAADYDQLSATGAVQARALGDWLVAQEMRFDRVVRGGLRRHAQTLDGIGAAYAEAGLALPTAQVDSAFDEFDHRQVMRGFAAGQPAHPAVRAAAAAPDDPLRVFDFLRVALQSWVRGELDAVAEPWARFRARTRDAAAALAERAAGESVLLVSSGGVIAQLAAEALQVPDLRSIELNLSLRNAALCELSAGSDGLRLGSWNALPHLAQQRALWTYV